MTTGRSCLFVVVLAALATPVRPEAARRPEPAPLAGLVVVWKADLGAAERRAVHRTAVCSDGTTFLVDSGGRVVTVSPDGEVVSDHDVLFPGGFFAATCGGDGALVVATHDGPRTRLTAFRRGARLPLWTRPVREGAFQLGPVHAIAAADPDTFVLLVGERTGGVRLASVTAEGDVRWLTPLVRTEAEAVGAAGSVVWDPVRRRTVYVAASEYVIHLHDASGRLVDRVDLGRRLGTGRGERAYGTARLPDGGLAVQIMADSAARRPDSLGPRLEVLDSDLKPARIVGGGFGPLIGADGQGALYFGGVGAGRAAIVKARLRPVAEAVLAPAFTGW